MITSVIFDMDGVLVDSQPMHYDADLLTLEHFGVHMTLSELETYAGTTNPNRYTRFKEVYQMPWSVMEMVAFREETVMRFIYEYNLQAIEGVTDFLKSIKAEGLKTALASSSSYDFIYAILDKLEIRQYFDQVVSGEDMEHGKPSPDIFLAAAKMLNSDPTECVVVEDSTNGVLAANRAGMKVVGYVNLNSGEQDLSTATCTVDHFGRIRPADLYNISAGDCPPL